MDIDNILSAIASSLERLETKVVDLEEKYYDMLYDLRHLEQSKQDK